MAWCAVEDEGALKERGKINACAQLPGLAERDWSKAFDDDGRLEASDSLPDSLAVGVEQADR